VYNLYRKSLVGAAVLLLLGACVTVNIYFPAAAAERAADRIIEDVWGEQPAGGASGEEGGGAPQGESRAPVQGSILVAVSEALIPAAHAQQADLNVSTPAIEKLTASMRARHDQLRPYYEQGAIGLTSEGLVEIRDLAAVALAERQKLKRLVAQENQDRNALYREIARANGHPEWEDEIRGTFARRWVENAPRGWWYREGGQWRQK